METFSASLAFCAGNSPASGEFPAQRLVTRSFDVFYDLWPNKRVSKQSRGWWFETLSRPFWCHCNVLKNKLRRATGCRLWAFLEKKDCHQNVRLYIIMITGNLCYVEACMILESIKYRDAKMSTVIVYSMICASIRCFTVNRPWVISLKNHGNDGVVEFVFV